MASSRSIITLFSKHLLKSLNNNTATNLRWISCTNLQRSDKTNTTSPETNTDQDSTTDTPHPDAELQEKIETLCNDFNDMKDKYQRVLADRENVRLRLEKQVTDAKLYGIQGFCKELVEVSEIFRTALDSVPKEEVEKGNEHLRSLYGGLGMTEAQLIAVFRRNGLVSESSEEGSKFDPSWQEAMFEVPCTQDDHQPGTVAHILRRGWKLHGRCIRSAQVGVYAKS